MKTITIAYVLMTLFAACSGGKKASIQHAHYDNDDKCITEKCIHLPRASMPTIEDVVAQPPMYFIYSLSHGFDCSVVSNVKSPSGTTCYSGKSHITPINSTVLNVMTFSFCENNQPCLTAIDSKTGLSQTWYIWDFEYSEQCSWLCGYSCRKDEEKFEEFICMATNDDKLEKIEEIVKEAKRCICNGRHIHDARVGCPEVNICPLN